MKGIECISPVLEAPNLEELQLYGQLTVTEADVERINAHGKLRGFDWIHLDVPARLFRPAMEAVTLSKPWSGHDLDWFRQPRPSS